PRTPRPPHCVVVRSDYAEISIKPKNLRLTCVRAIMWGFLGLTLRYPSARKLRNRGNRRCQNRSKNSSAENQQDAVSLVSRHEALACSRVLARFVFCDYDEGQRHSSLFPRRNEGISKLRRARASRAWGAH